MIALPWQPPVYVLLLCTCSVGADMARDVDVWRPLVTCDSTTSEGCRTSNSQPPAAWLPDRGDAVAFVRHRKTAGTLLHHHMERVLGFACRGVLPLMASATSACTPVPVARARHAKPVNATGRKAPAGARTLART